MTYVENPTTKNRVKMSIASCPLKSNTVSVSSSSAAKEHMNYENNSHTLKIGVKMKYFVY